MRPCLKIPTSQFTFPRRLTLRTRHQRAMAERYVPPARRDTTQSTNSEAFPKADEGVHSLKEIQRYFWPNQEFKPASGLKTLHDSASTPGIPSYVLLFRDANPGWKEKGVIFAKSNLELLAAEPAGNLNAPGSPDSTEKAQTKDIDEGADSTKSKQQSVVAVFSQVEYSPTARIFKFEGWHRIAQLDFLEPRSVGLVHMLDLKFKTTSARGQVKEKERQGRTGTRP